MPPKEVAIQFHPTFDGPVEEWVAIAGGGFVRATYDLPAMLYEADLMSLYNILVAEDLHDLVKRHEAGEESFLLYLKDTVGMAKLGDRKILANCLARAQRLGQFSSAK